LNPCVKNFKFFFRHGLFILPSIICQACWFIGQNMLNTILPDIRLPGAQILVGQIIVLGNGMGPDNDIQAIFGGNEFTKGIQAMAGWIPHHQTGGQMNLIGAIFFHFHGGIFYVSSGTAAAGGVSFPFYSVCLRLPIFFLVGCVGKHKITLFKFLHHIDNPA
jgi:hypothetical protein